MLDTFPVTNTLQDVPFDEAGTASVSVTLPAVEDGRTVLIVRGTSTDTTVLVPIETSDGKAETSVSGEDQQVFDGQAVSIPVTVDPAAATGTVTAKDGDTVVGSATLAGDAATIDIAAGLLDVGGHTLTLVYSGDAAFEGSEGQVVVTVNPLATTTTTATAGDMVYGTAGSVAVTVTSSSAVTGGSVQLLEGAAEIATGTLGADGKVTLAIPGTALTVGSHTLTVTYLGDSASKPSQTNVGVTVAKAGSTTQLTVASTSVVVGQGTVTAIATVAATGFTPSGNVEFYVNGTLAATQALTSGSAQAVLGPFINVANRTVVATYVGAANASASESTAKVVTVTKATPTMTVTVSPNPAGTKDPVRVTVSLAATGQVVTGSVVVRIDGRVLNGTLVNGSVVINTSKIPKAGTYPVVVTYGGSTLAETVTQTISLVVRK